MTTLCWSEIGRFVQASDSSEDGIFPTRDSSSLSESAAATGCFTNSFGLQIEQKLACDSLIVITKNWHTKKKPCARPSHHARC